MDISDYFDGRFELEKHWLLHKDYFWHLAYAF